MAFIITCVYLFVIFFWFVLFLFVSLFLHLPASCKLHQSRKETILFITEYPEANRASSTYMVDAQYMLVE